MQFVFKRDEEGRERIYVGDVCVAHTNDVRDIVWQPVTHYTGVSSEAMDAAIERADEAGFWKSSAELAQEMRQKDRRWSNALMTFRGKWATNEVAVDVPVADNAVLSVTVGGDES